jgi:hypothetical protein
MESLSTTTAATAVPPKPVTASQSPAPATRAPETTQLKSSSRSQDQTVRNLYVDQVTGP